MKETIKEYLIDIMKIHYRTKLNSELYKLTQEMIVKINDRFEITEEEFNECIRISSIKDDK